MCLNASGLVFASTLQVNIGETIIQSERSKHARCLFKENRGVLLVALRGEHNFKKLTHQGNLTIVLLNLGQQF